MYTCNDAMDDIQSVVVNHMCQSCPTKDKCWGDGEPSIDGVAACAMNAILRACAVRDEIARL